MSRNLLASAHGNLDLLSADADRFFAGAPATNFFSSANLFGSILAAASTDHATLQTLVAILFAWALVAHGTVLDTATNVAVLNFAVVVASAAGSVFDTFAGNATATDDTANMVMASNDSFGPVAVTFVCIGRSERNGCKRHKQ
jgi:hypothetical protein